MVSGVFGCKSRPSLRLCAADAEENAPALSTVTRRKQCGDFQQRRGKDAKREYYSCKVMSIVGTDTGAGRRIRADRNVTVGTVESKRRSAWKAAALASKNQMTISLLQSISLFFIPAKEGLKIGDGGGKVQKGTRRVGSSFKPRHHHHHHGSHHHTHSSFLNHVPGICASNKSQMLGSFCLDGSRVVEPVVTMTGDVVVVNWRGFGETPESGELISDQPISIQNSHDSVQMFTLVLIGKQRTKAHLQTPPDPLNGSASNETVGECAP